MLPTVLFRKDVHGPVAVGPTCFERLIAGEGVFTRTFAVAVFPVPPFVDVTLPVVLVYVPVVVPVTVTLNEQVPPATIVVVFRSAIILVAAVVVRLFIPPQTENVPSATDSPKGNTSVNATPVKPVDALGLVMSKSSEVVLPVKIGFALNDLAITGEATTVNEDVPEPVAVVLGPESVEVMLPLTLV